MDKKEMLINLTPHIVNIFVDGKEKVTLSPSGIVPRCSQTEEQVMVVDGIPVSRQVFGEVVDLPAPKDGVYLIVSRLVAAACPDRDDLLCLGPMVRGQNGQPIGCNGLAKI